MRFDLRLTLAERVGVAIAEAVLCLIVTGVRVAEALFPPTPGARRHR